MWLFAFGVAISFSTYWALGLLEPKINCSSHSNLHGVDDDVYGRVCDDENVAEVCNDVLRHP